MPPKQSKTAVKRTSAKLASGKAQPKQNKLNFSNQASRPFGSRPLALTPSFTLPSAPPPFPESASDDVNRPSSSTSTTGRVQSPNEASSSSDASLWSEKVAPVRADELAVHPRKVQDVRRWLTEALRGDEHQSRCRKVLTLTGPSGSGKSAVIHALSSQTELDYQTLEWTNVSAYSDSSTYEPGSSFIERFTNFLHRGASFPALDMQHPSESNASSSRGTVRARRVLLIDDLPNIHHHPTRMLFQAALEHYIDQSVALSGRGLPNVPIVIIVTECAPRDDQDRWMADSSGSAWRERLASIVDTRTALSERIRLHPAHTEIRFNPVAPTILVNGLKRALELHSVKVGKSKAGTLSSEVIQAIAMDASGDIRAAMNCLQFAYSNDHLRAKPGKVLTAEQRQDSLRKLLPLISGRGSSLALFHAIGRVLYNKRVGDPGEETKDKRLADLQHLEEDNDVGQDTSALTQRLATAMSAIGISTQSSFDDTYDLPKHLMHLKKSASHVDVDQLWGDLPVDASMFQLYLHQNYPPFTTELDECEMVLDNISTADAFTSSPDQHRHATLMSYYSFLITVRGTLLGLPSPVPRKNQKMGKATYWDVQKKLRQRIDTIDEVRLWLASSTKRYDVITRSDGDARVDSRFKRVKFTNQNVMEDRDNLSQEFVGGGESSSSWLMKCDTLSLATEVLPLLAKIQPSGFPSEWAKSARMRFEYAGVSDLASRMLGEYDLAIDQDEETDPTQKPEISGAREKSIPTYLSEDDIDDF